MKTNELLQKAEWLPGDGERQLWAGLEERVAKRHKLLGMMDMFINLTVEIFSYVRVYICQNLSNYILQKCQLNLNKGIKKN